VTGGRRRRTPPAVTRPVGLVALAAAAAVLVVATDGPVRALAGAALGLYLPGRLAVLWLLGRTADRVLAVVLTLTLSLVATMLVGLVAAAARRVEPAVVAVGLLVVCGLLAGGAWARAGRAEGTRPGSVEQAGPAEQVGSVEQAGPAEQVGSVERAGLAGRGRRLAIVAAAIPAVLLAGVMAVRIVDVVRYTPADGYYTELSVRSGAGRSAVVHSRERDPTRFRLEERVDGVVVQTAMFTLGPGQRGDVGLLTSSAAGRVEVVLYKMDQDAPYRRVTI
jgi:hypothetical protein